MVTAYADLLKAGDSEMAVVKPNSLDDSNLLQQIIAAGFDPDTVARVTRLVRLAEYKRRQAPPGPKISPRAFGRDRRYPVTSAWR